MSKIKIIALLLVFILVLYFCFATDLLRFKSVTDFESCLAYGGPVMESYPRQCRDKEGGLYIEAIYATSTVPMASTTDDGVQLDSNI